MKEWTAAITLAIVTAATAAGMLFLAGPMLLESRRDYARHHEVSQLGWNPAHSISFLNIDSIAKSGSIPALCIRYGAEAPGRLDLSVVSVLPDGSEKQDTMEIELRNVYGEPLGARGYGVSEILYPFMWNVNVADCRLMEISPLGEVEGIYSVGLLIDNDGNNENHIPSATKASEI